MVLINILIIIFWYFFIFWLFNKLGKTTPLSLSPRLIELKIKRGKSLQEQLEYTKLSEQTYISMPLILVIVTIFSVFSIYHVKYLRMFSEPFTFQIGILGIIISCLMYSWWIIKIKPTLNNPHYFGLIFIYCLMMSFSILLSTYYPTSIHWLILIVIILVVYTVCRRYFEWEI